MNRNMLKKILCVILVIAIAITTSYSTEQSIYAAEIAKEVQVENQSESTEYVESTEDIESTEVIESTEDIESTEVIESTEDIELTEMPESAEDIELTEMPESTEVIELTENVLYAVRGKIPSDHSLSSVYWNPNSDNTLSGAGQVQQIGGDDNNSGSTAKEPVLNLETALRRAASDAVIYCMNYYGINQAASIDGGYYDISIKRHDSHKGNIIQITNSQVKLSNITLDGSDDFEERVLTVASNGTLEIGDSLGVVDQTQFYVETAANPIILSGVPEAGTVYQVEFAEKYYENNPVMTENGKEKLLVNAKASGLNPEQYFSIKNVPEGWTVYTKDGTELWARYEDFGDIIWLDGVNGNDSNNGFSPDQSVKTWEKAYELYQTKLEGNGTICIKGTVTVDGRALEIQKSVIKRLDGYTNPLFEIKEGGALSIRDNVQIDSSSSYYAIKSSGGLTVSKSAAIEEKILLVNNNQPLVLTGSGINSYKIGVGGNFTDGDLVVKNGIYPTVQLVEGDFTIRAVENDSYLYVPKPVYVNGASGDDAYDGLSPQTAVKTLNRAIEIAQSVNSAYIYVLGGPAQFDRGECTLPQGMNLERYTSYQGDVLKTAGGMLHIEGYVNGSVLMTADSKLTLEGTYASVEDDIVISENASFTLEQGTVKGNMDLSGKAAVTQNGGEILGSVTLKENSIFLQNEGLIRGTIVQNGAGSSVEKNGGTMNGQVSITAGTFVMNAGVIAKSGVVLEQNGNGNFILHGGEIKECYAPINALSGSIQMDGGIITSYSSGNAVSLDTAAVMNMTGGVIKKQDASDSSIQIGGTLTLGGDSVIENRIVLKNADHPIKLESLLSDGAVFQIDFAGNFIESGQRKIAVDGIDSAPATAKQFELAATASYLLSLEEENSDLYVCVESDPEGIYLGGSKGSDKNTGEDRDHSVQTFERAKELLQEAYEKDGKQYNIYLCGNISISSTENSQIWSLEEFDWNPVLMRCPSNTQDPYKIRISYGGSLTIKDIILDGNKNINATSDFIRVDGYYDTDHISTLTVLSGAVVQNINYVGRTGGYSGGGITIASGGKFILDGGCIRNNRSAYGGVIFLSSSSDKDNNSSTLEMKSGAIEFNETYATGNDSASNGGGVYCTYGSTFIMEGGAIRNNKSEGFGGGLCSQYSRVEIRGGEITGNESRQGGGVYTSGDDILMTGGKISGNYAILTGGGIEVTINKGKEAVINGGEISENYALKYGGGIYCYGNLCIKDGIIKSNRAKLGGGIALYKYYDDAILTLQGGSIIENEADYGGGIYWYNLRPSTFSSLVLEGGIIGENHALKGNGIYKEGNTSGGPYGISLGATQIDQEIYLGSETVNMYMISSPTDITKSFPLTIDPQAAKMGLVVVSPDNKNVTNAAQYLRNFYLKGTSGYALVKSGKNIILGQAFFVDGVNGNDTNKGNSPENAFLTVKRAIEALGNDPGTIYVCGTVTVNETEIWEMKEGQSLTRYEGEATNGTDGNAFRGDMIVIGDGAELTMNCVTVYGSLDKSSEDKNGYLLVQGGNLNISSDSSLEDGTVYLKDGKTVTVTGNSTELLMEVEKENPVEGDTVGRYQTPKTANAANFKLSEQMSGFILVEDENKNNVVLEQADAVYVDGVNGSDANDGTSPETALRTLRQAYEKIKAKGGILYIVDTVSISADSKLAATSYQDEKGTVETSGTVYIMRYNGNKNPLININSGLTILSGIRIDGGGAEAEVHASPLVKVGTEAVLYVEENAQLKNNYSTGDGGAVNNSGTVNLSSCRIEGNTASKGSAIYQAGILNIESAGADIGEGEVYFAEGAFMNIHTRLARETVFHINMDSSDAVEGRKIAVFSEDAFEGDSVEAQKIHFYVNPLTTKKTVSAEGSDTLVLSNNFDAEIIQTEFFRKIGQSVTFNVVPRNADPSEVTVTVKNGVETVPCTVKDYNRYKKISLEVTEESIGTLTLEIQSDSELVEKTIIISGYDILYAKDQQGLIAEPQKNSGGGVHTDTAQIVIYNGADEEREFDAESISICYDDDSEVRIDNDAVSRNMEDAMKCFGFDVDIMTEIPANGEVSMPVVFSNGDNLTESKMGTITLENAVFGNIWTKIDLRYETKPLAGMQVCVYLDGEITTEPDVYVVNKTTGEKTELTKMSVKTPGTVERAVKEFLEVLGAAFEEQVWPYYKTGLDEGDYKLYINDMDTGKELQVKEGQTVSQKINLYTVTYVLNGGEFDSERETSDIYIEGMGLSELPSPSRESARFAGWYESEDFTGTSVARIGTESKKPYTLYAAWTMQDEWTDVSLEKTEYLEKMGSGLILEAEIEGILPKEITVQVLQETADGKTRTVPAKVTDSSAYKLITVEVSPENIGSLTLLFEQKDNNGITINQMERTVELSAYEVSYANNLGYLLAAPQEDGIEEIHTDRAAITFYNGSRDTVRFTPGSWEASYEGNPDENVWIDNSMVDKNMSEKNAMRYFGMTLEPEESTEIKPGKQTTVNVILSNGDLLTENRSGVITMKNAGLGNAKADILLDFKVKAITRFQLQLQLNDEMANEENVELRDDNGKTVIVNKMRTGNENTLVFAYRALTGKTDIRWNYQLTNITPGSYRLYINGKDANRRIRIEEGEIVQEKVDMYSIRYELNEGTVEGEMPSYYIKGAIQTLPIPVKKNSQFAGWYISGTFSGDAIWEIGASASGILKLYAKWGEITASTGNQNIQISQASREFSTGKTPKTSDRNLIIVDIAFVGGIACLAKMFLEMGEDSGMDEEDKERRIRSIIESAKGRGMLAGIGAAGMIFVTLLFYYTLGMKDEVRREMQK